MNIYDLCRKIVALLSDQPAPVTFAVPVSGTIFEGVGQDRKRVNTVVFTIWWDDVSLSADVGTNLIKDSPETVAQLLKTNWAKARAAGKP